MRRVALWPTGLVIVRADSKGISQDQLAKEVRANYSGHVMVQNKVIDVEK
jgi:hypothetical protein